MLSTSKKKNCLETMLKHWGYILEEWDNRFYDSNFFYQIVAIL